MAQDMTWTQVAGRLARARSYWLVTGSTEGGPHAAPVWGVVVDEDLYLYTERTTVKARNLAADPRLVVHLESAEDVVIVHGRAADLGPPSDNPAVVAALALKYDDPEDAVYLPSGDPDFDVLYAVRPDRALAWELSDWETSQRRWSGS